MNLILADCEEFRKLKKKSRCGALAEPIEQKRLLGFILLRGQNVVSITVEGPPPPGEDVPRMPNTSRTGRGSGSKRVAGRGRGLPSDIPLPTMMSGNILNLSTTFILKIKFLFSKINNMNFNF